jgi:murein DD-endopeptidase MepM/ murein hydrolase activator NlpD
MAIADLIDGGGAITEPYGPNQPYQPCPGSFNPGLDVAADCGKITRAIGYGYVVSVGRPCWAGPHAVIIASGNVWILYAHQGAHFVRGGQLVAPGSAVGAIGSMTGGTCCGASQANPCAASQNCGGVATGPHIHWQVNPAGVPFDSAYCRVPTPLPSLAQLPALPPACPPPPPPPPAPIAPQASGLIPALLVAGGLAIAYGMGGVKIPR